ncbi:MAG: hypothetical protein ABW166_05805 [Sedimenticola sp.]
MSPTIYCTPVDTYGIAKMLRELVGDKACQPGLITSGTLFSEAPRSLTK